MSLRLVVSTLLAGFRRGTELLDDDGASLAPPLVPRARDRNDDAGVAAAVADDDDDDDVFRIELPPPAALPLVAPSKEGEREGPPDARCARMAAAHPLPLAAAVVDGCDRGDSNSRANDLEPGM